MKVITGCDLNGKIQVNFLITIQFFWPLGTEFWKKGKYWLVYSTKQTNYGLSLFNAAHCLWIAGGVKWRKFGIFINSALANFPGGAAPGTTHPWCKGNGTLAGWKTRATGQTEGQSWSTGILLVRGGWTGVFLKLLFRRFPLTFTLLARRSKDLNSSSPSKRNLVLNHRLLKHAAIHVYYKIEQFHTNISLFYFK